MNIKEKYTEVIRVLKKNTPELSDKGNLTDQILRGIKDPAVKRPEQEKQTIRLFGRTGLYWVRISMTSAALFFIALFIVQQFMITNRLKRLEDQLVGQLGRAEVHGSDRGIYLDLQNDDSLMVSRSDLEALLKEYAEMRNSKESAHPAYYDQESRIKYLLRKQREKIDTIHTSI